MENRILSAFNVDYRVSYSDNRNKVYTVFVELYYVNGVVDCFDVCSVSSLRKCENIMGYLKTVCFHLMEFGVEVE